MTVVILDLAGERWARAVHGLSSMTRSELERFLEANARESASAILVRARAPKPEKVPSWRRRRDRWR